MYFTFKDKGIDLAKQAVVEDEAQNYDKALQLYLASLEYFNSYLKWEKNAKCREAITRKFKEYCTRAEYLKGVVGQDSSGRPDEGATAATKVRKPGVGGAGDDDKETGAQMNRVVASPSAHPCPQKPTANWLSLVWRVAFPGGPWDDVAGLEGAKEAVEESACPVVHSINSSTIVSQGVP
eukprot:gene27689-7330_t